MVAASRSRSRAVAMATPAWSASMPQQLGLVPAELVRPAAVAVEGAQRRAGDQQRHRDHRAVALLAGHPAPGQEGRVGDGVDDLHGPCAQEGPARRRLGLAVRLEDDRMVGVDLLHVAAGEAVGALMISAVRSASGSSTAQKS